LITITEKIENLEKQFLAVW